MNIVVIIIVLYIVSRVWEALNEARGDRRRENWSRRVYGQSAPSSWSSQEIGGVDYSALRREYRKFANLYSGSTVNSALFEAPRVAFVHKGASVTLGVFQGGSSPDECYTQLIFTMKSGWPHRLEISPQRYKDEENIRYLRIDDIQIGDPTFDPRYVIKSSKPEFAKEFLDTETKKAIEDLRSLLSNDAIRVSLNTDRMLIRKLGVIDDIQTLIAFGELAIILYDRTDICYEKAIGVEIVSSEIGKGADAPVCQVCGVPIADKMIFCKKCKTPHHRDCWDYNGRCSTYACGEKTFSEKY